MFVVRTREIRNMFLSTFSTIKLPVSCSVSHASHLWRHACFQHSASVLKTIDMLYAQGVPNISLRINDKQKVHSMSNPNPWLELRSVGRKHLKWLLKNDFVHFRYTFCVKSMLSWIMIKELYYVLIFFWERR